MPRIRRKITGSRSLRTRRQKRDRKGVKETEKGQGQKRGHHSLFGGQKRGHHSLFDFREDRKGVTTHCLTSEDRKGVTTHCLTSEPEPGTFPVENEIRLGKEWWPLFLAPVQFSKLYMQIINYMDGYAERLKTYRRWGKACSHLAIMAMLCWIGYQFALTVIMPVYWNYRCETFEMPSEMVVAGSQGDLISTENPSLCTYITCGSDHCVFFMVLPKDEYEMTSNVPALGNGFSMKIPRFKRIGIAFMHARRATGKAKRIVLIELNAMSSNNLSSNTQFLTLSGKTVIPSSGMRVNGGEIRLPTTFGPIQLFAGQPDPADESHFTMKYCLGSQTGIIDGWLLPSECVKLQIRNGPAINSTKKEDRKGVTTHCLDAEKGPPLY